METATSSPSVSLCHYAVSMFIALIFLEFGFQQTSVVGFEDASDIMVNMGFLEGSLDETVMVDIAVIFHPPGESC